MNLFQTIILALIQGLTEFIPVSSSGHLSLLPQILGWKEQSTAFDIVLHGGTLLALIIFFWPKLKTIIQGVRKKDVVQINLVKVIGIGALPALIIGGMIEGINLISDDRIDNLLKNPYSIIFFMILMGFVLILSDFLYKKNVLDIERLKTKHILIIGFLQCLALIRGVSRSGITIFAGLTQGLRREDAAEYSFLMGIPLIAISFIAQLGKFIIKPDLSIGIEHYIIGFIIAFISGYFAVKFMLSFLKKHGLAIFGIYRIIFAIIAFIIIIAR